MTELRTAAQQALEALEEFGTHYEHCPRYPTWARPEMQPPCNCGLDSNVAALRAALAQQEPDLRNANPIGLTPPQKALQQKQFRAALEQPEQEPVAWMLQHRDTGRKNYVSNDGCNGPGRFLVMNPRYALVCALYAHPPRREWQGLTNPDIARVFRSVYGGSRFGASEKEFAIAVEDLLKEKNNG